MSFRSNHTMQTRIENKRFSYRQVRRKSQKQISYQSSSQSQESIEQQKHNFNSGHNLKNIQVSSSDKSESSQNQTQNFIRAQFKPSLVNKIEDFKLFSRQIEKSRQQKEILNNACLKSNKDNKKRKETYDTAYFQISLQDQTNNQQIGNQKISSRKQFPIQIPSVHISQMLSQRRQRQNKFHFFQELEFLQKTIMKTLKQKQKHVQILVKEVENLNEQKIHNFKINQELQVELQLLREKSNQNLVENPNWKPKNVEEMKLQIDNQKLNDQLKKIEKQQFLLKEIEDQLKEQEKVLKQSLKSALRTRKQYAKSLVKSSNQSRQQKDDLQIKIKDSQNSRINSIGRQKSFKQKRTRSKKQNKNTINHQIKQPSSKIEPLQNQLNQLQEKELLIKLLNDFNDLKAKVDQSLITKQKQKSTITKNQSTAKKNKRTVINFKK